MTGRRLVLQALAAVPLAGGLPASAQAPMLPHPSSLAAEIERALAQRKALVVLVSLVGCPYCKAVRESYLVPLRAEGQPVVQIEMGGALPLADARGQPATHDQVVRAAGIRVAPTVLFLGRAGQALAPPLVGMGIPDFYGAYLQQRVDAANRAAGA